MRARFFNRDFLAALLMLAVALGGYESVGAGGPQQGEKIQFSDVPVANPGPSPVVVSNLNRLAPNESSFKQVKEDLMRPFGSFDPRNAMMDNAMSQPLPMPQRPVMSRRALEIQDKKRNWIFTSYQELFMSQDDVERKMFGIKEYNDDGREKRQDSVVESYYESLGRRDLATNSQSMEEARAKFLMLNGFDPYGKAAHADGAFTQASFQFETPDSIVDKSESSMMPGAGSFTNLTSSLPEGLGLRTKRISELDSIRQSILGSAAMPIYQAGQEKSSLLTADDSYLQKPKSAADNLFNQQMNDANSIKMKSANPFVLMDPTANALHSHVNDDLTAKALGLPQPSSAATNNYYTRPAATAQTIEAEHDPFGANRPETRVLSARSLIIPKG